MAVTKANRGKDYTFTLTSEIGEKTLIYNPIGWDSINYVLSRKDQKDGIFVTFSADLEFVKDGYTYIKQLLDAYGILANCSLTIKEKGVIISHCKLDFTSQVETPDSRNGIRIPITSDSFSEKIKAREEIEIPYNRLETLDGETITAHDDEYVDVTVYGMSIVEKNIENAIYEATYTCDENNAWALPQFVAKEGYTDITIQNVNQTNFPNSIIDYDLYPYAFPDVPYNYHCFLWAKEKTFVSLDWSIVFETRRNVGTINGWKLGIFHVEFNSLGEYVAYKSTVGYMTGTGVVDDTFIGSGSVQLEQYEGLMFVVATDASNLGVEVESWMNIKANYINIDIKQDSASTVSKFINAWELHNRIAQSITGEADSFKSSIFERPTGKWSHLGFANGKMIRGFTPEQANPVFSLKDLSEDLEKYLNVGYGIIYEDGKYKLIAEDKKYFYQSSPVYEIKNIKAETFTREFNPQYWYAAIKTGAEKSAYEQVSGLEEYNNKSAYSTILSVLKNELDLIAKTRNDGYGIEFAKRINYEDNATTDTQYDTDNWIFEMIESGGVWSQRDKEDFAIVNGLEGVDHAINLNLTPARTVYRWGWWIRACLEQYKTSFIKFNSSDALSDLATQRSDESFLVEENKDIPVSALEQPFFTGYIFKFEAPVKLADFQTIMNNPYGLFYFDNPITGKESQGWLIEVSTSPIEEGGQSNWLILEAKSLIEILKAIMTENGKLLLTESGKVILFE